MIYQHNERTSERTISTMNSNIELSFFEHLDAQIWNEIKSNEMKSSSSLSSPATHKFTINVWWILRNCHFQFCEVTAYSINFTIRPIYRNGIINRIRPGPNSIKNQKNHQPNLPFPSTQIIPLYFLLSIFFTQCNFSEVDYKLLIYSQFFWNLQNLFIVVFITCMQQEWAIVFGYI